MALEYVLEAAADLTTEEIRSFMVDATDGEVLGSFVRCDALEVTAYREDPDDEGPIADMLGFTNRVTARFRIPSRSSFEERNQATIVIIRTVLAFFDRYPGDGVLLFNGEQVVMQRVNGPVVIDSDREDWTDVPGMSEVVAGLEGRSLPQPLL